MENTLILVKPDGVHRGLVGTIISRFERKGFRLRAIKMIMVDDDLAARHYRVHKGKDFYDNLIRFITSGPVVAMVWTGWDVIRLVRHMVGATRPEEAAPGTIRGDYSSVTCNNLVHASDSLESARREISNFFEDDELVEWEPALGSWFGSPPSL